MITVFSTYELGAKTDIYTKKAYKGRNIAVRTHKTVRRYVFFCRLIYCERIRARYATTGTSIKARQAFAKSSSILDKYHAIPVKICGKLRSKPNGRSFEACSRFPVTEFDGGYWSVGFKHLNAVYIELQTSTPFWDIQTIFQSTSWNRTGKAKLRLASHRNWTQKTNEMCHGNLPNVFLHTQQKFVDFYLRSCSGVYPIVQSSTMLLKNQPWS